MINPRTRAASVGAIVWGATLVALLLLLGRTATRRASVTEILPLQLVEAAPPVSLRRANEASGQGEARAPDIARASASVRASGNAGSTGGSGNTGRIGPADSRAHEPPATSRVQPPRSSDTVSANHHDVSGKSAPASHRDASRPSQVADDPSANAQQSQDTSRVRSPSQPDATSSSHSEAPEESPASSRADAGTPSHDGPAASRSGDSAAAASTGARATHQPLPDVPDELRDEAFTAVALARFVVHTDGQCDVSLIEATRNPTLNRLLLASLRQWRFAPASEHGHAVETTVDLRVHFNVQ